MPIGPFTTHSESSPGALIALVRPGRVMRRTLAAVLALAAIGVLVAGSARGAPTPFRLTFDGVQRPATFPSVGELQHEGAFTASAPFCAAGYAADVKQVFRPPVSSIRRFACSDRSGGIVVRVDRFPAEHVLHGHGAWTIVAGTGRYARLGGHGTWTTVAESGERFDPATTRFRTVWRGVVESSPAERSES